VQTTLPVPLADGLSGVAVDSAGDVFVTNTGSDSAEPAVLERPAGSSTLQTLPFGPLSDPWSIAVDGAGDVFVTELFQGVNAVLELPAGSSAQQVLPFAGLNAPEGVAVDAAGDVFAANTGANDVLELPAQPGGGYGPQLTLPFTGLNQPSAVTVGAAGDIFVGDGGNSRVVELPAGATSSSQQVTVPFTGLNLYGGNFPSPNELAVDAAGDLYSAIFEGDDYQLAGYEASSTALTSLSPAVPVAGQPFTVNVTVSGAPAAGGGVFSGAPSGPVTVSDGNGQTCTATLSGGSGSCQLTEAATGPYTLTASYPGLGAFTASSGTAGVNVDTGPAFVTASPPLTAIAGSAYGYTFTASGTPAPRYALAAGPRPGCRSTPPPGCCRVRSRPGRSRSATR
jgi:hypothetical protein